MKTKPVSYVKAHFAEVLEAVKSTGDGVLVTQNGAGAAVIVSHETWQQSRKALAMLKLLAMGERDFEAGRAFTQDEVFRQARARLRRRARGE
ncbi:MAG: type II toxin-antitoxin system Phd/YefM family antitoxin [Myxococcota bacterium]